MHFPGEASPSRIRHDTHGEEIAGERAYGQTVADELRIPLRRNNDRTATMLGDSAEHLLWSYGGVLRKLRVDLSDAYRHVKQAA